MLTPSAYIFGSRLRRSFTRARSRIEILIMHDKDSESTNLMRVRRSESETDFPSSLAAEVMRYAQIVAAGETTIEQLHEQARMISHIDELLRGVHLSCMKHHAETLHRDIRDIESQNSQKSAELEISEFQQHIRRDASVRALESILVDIESSNQLAEKRAVELALRLTELESTRTVPSSIHSS